MKPAQEFVVKMAIGIVVLSVLATATYLVAALVLSVLPGNYTVAAVSAAAFFLAGFVSVMSWIRRQTNEWWGQ